MMKIADKIHMIEISRIKPYENNPRVNDHVVPALMKSIKRFGFNSPIAITRDMTIVNGHTRFKAAKALGMKSIPCVFVDDLTEEEIAAYRLADNKIGELAYWDMSKVEDEMAKIGEALDMIDFGFKPDTTINIMENETEEEEEEEEEFHERKPMIHRCPKCGEIFED